jgi:hypothetical protein
MTIISSVIADNVIQRDGRRSIVEHHTDQLGIVYRHIYLSVGNANLNAALAAYAAQLDADLTNNEIQANIGNVTRDGSLAVTSTIYSTGAQNFSALREAYRTAARVEAIMIGDFLSSLTDAQLRTAFSMTQAEVNTLRTNKLTPSASAATTIRSTVGA